MSNELTKITIKGFKSIASIENLTIKPVNIIIGANGSGKSNFINAFEFLGKIRNGKLADVVHRMGGANALLHFGVKTTNNMEFNLFFGEGYQKYSLILKATEEDLLYPAEERVTFLNTQSEKVKNKTLSKRVISKTSKKDDLETFSSFLENWSVFHFHDTSMLSPMKRLCELDDNSFLREDGSNLAAFLFLLKQKHQEKYQLIRKTIQGAAPFFADFDLKPLRTNNEKIKLEWKHKKSDAYFGPSSLSDGTLRFIALATLFLQPKEYKPSVILIDEPELGLHPAAVTLLASLIKSASKEVQVIASTQSSLLLDYFNPKDVVVAERKSSETVMTRLTEEPLKEWLEDYSLGQLWEKNEIGGRPNHE